MIQAGTISTGSATTCSVAGLYWMSSISSLRKTTSPGVTARSLPTSRPSAGGSRLHGERAPDILLEIDARRARDWRRISLSVALDDHRVEPRHIRRRPHIEQLAGDEGDAGGVLRRHAAHLAGGARPPRFLGEEGLLPQRVRKPFQPASVKRRSPACGSNGSSASFGQAVGGKARKAGADIGGLDAQFDEPAGSIGKMRGPVEPGSIERVRRDALGQPGRHGAAETVHGLEGGDARVLACGGRGEA